MKKFFWLFFLLGFIFLWGCTNQDEVDAIKQQNYLLQQQMNQLQEQKNAAAQELQDQKDAAIQASNFENNLKCQERWDALKIQYNNFASAYYNEYANTCYVRYYDIKNNNQILEAPMDQMVSIIKETPLSYWAYTIKIGVNFRTSPSVNWSIIQKIDPTNVVTIISSSYDAKADLWYYIDFNWNYWYISSVAFK